MINGPYSVFRQLSGLNPWVPGADLEVALVQVGQTGQTGFSFHWESNLLTVDGWRVYISNDPDVFGSITPWQLENWKYNIPMIMGHWHEITTELIPSPATPAGGSPDNGWINIANDHSAYVRLAATINAHQAPATGDLSVWFNGVGW